MAREIRGGVIKPGSKNPTREDYDAIASEAITAGNIVYITGAKGEFLTVGVADKDTAVKARGDLFVAKNTAVSGGRLRVSPFATIKTIDTSASTIGYPVYLSTAGAVTLTRPTTGFPRRIGNVTKLGAAGTGEMQISRHSTPLIASYKGTFTNGQATFTFSGVGAGGITGAPLVAMLNTVDGVKQIIAAAWSGNDVVVTISAVAAATPVVSIMIAVD